jgi:hypothetical protein
MSLFTAILETVRPLLPDRATVWAARQYFNFRFQPLGEMTNLQIDAAKKTASLDLDLKGETQPLHITIERYELTTAGEKTFIEIKKFNTSREWINSLAREFLDGRKFEVPGAVKALL